MYVSILPIAMLPDTGVLKVCVQNRAKDTNVKLYMLYGQNFQQKERCMMQHYQWKSSTGPTRPLPEWYMMGYHLWKPSTGPTRPLAERCMMQYHQWNPLQDLPASSREMHMAKPLVKTLYRTYKTSSREMHEAVSLVKTLQDILVCSRQMHITEPSENMFMLTTTPLTESWSKYTRIQCRLDDRWWVLYVPTPS